MLLASEQDNLMEVPQPPIFDRAHSTACPEKCVAFLFSVDLLGGQLFEKYFPSAPNDKQQVFLIESLAISYTDVPTNI